MKHGKCGNGVQQVATIQQLLTTGVNLSPPASIPVNVSLASSPVQMKQLRKSCRLFAPVATKPVRERSREFAKKKKTPPGITAYPGQLVRSQLDSMFESPHIYGGNIHIKAIVRSDSQRRRWSLERQSAGGNSVYLRPIMRLFDCYCGIDYAVMTQCRSSC